jgi:hypothetical protein
MTIAWIYLDKKTAAVDALKDYAGMDFIIRNHRENMSEAQSKLTALPSASITRISKEMNPKAGEARLAASLDAIDILKERYRRALGYMEWFQPAWDSLTDDERFVLSEFYWEYEIKQIDAIGNICDRFHIERSSAYKKKNRALEKLATLLYGK